MSKLQQNKKAIALAVACATGAAAIAAITILIDGMEKSKKRPAAKRETRPPIPYMRFSFNLDLLLDETCVYYFRFNKQDIHRLVQVFALDELSYHYRIKPPPTTALCIVLFRLSRPRSYADMTRLFGHSPTWLCQTFNGVLEYLTQRYRQLIQWDDRRLTVEKLQAYAKATHDAGGPATVWGFLDGTFRPISRPIEGQRRFYSGHKKRHGLKFQGIVTPDGLISGLHGPFVGKIGDWKMWMRSEVPERLKSLLGHLDVADRPVVYGDKAYVMGGFGVIGAFTATGNRPLSRREETFNRTMTRFRIAVEHSFGRVTSLWQANEFTRGNIAGISAVAASYIVSVLLTNCKTCLHGNQSSDFFGYDPPSLEFYLGTSENPME